MLQTILETSFFPHGSPFCMGNKQNARNHDSVTLKIYCTVILQCNAVQMDRQVQKKKKTKQKKRHPD